MWSKQPTNHRKFKSLQSNLDMLESSETKLIIFKRSYIKVAITKERKTQTVEKFKTHEGDTGSPEVQIALITQRIDELSKHFEAHKKDFHSRIGLMQLVNQRKSLLSYLRKTDAVRYSKLIKELDLRK